MAQTRAQKVKQAKYDSFKAGGNVCKSYYQHGVLYGDYFDLRTYYNVKVTFNGTDTSKTRREEGTKRSDSLARSKNKIYRLISANCRKHGNYKPIFATVTFKEPITDLDTALRFYRRYITGLSKHLGKPIKYVAVPQIQWKRFQTEGNKVWHFHFVFFNVPKLDFTINDSLWGQGMVNLQFVRKAKDIGAYVAGYFTKKDFEEIPLNRRFYYCSRGLIQPTDVFHTDAIDSILKYGNVKVLQVYEGQSFTQTKYKLI